jgi:sugar (pentulose or hexulose) kinase
MLDLKKTVIGIELGSTRIKAVMLDKELNTLAQGEYEWENSFEGGIWTYSLDEVKKGLQECFRSLKREVSEEYGLSLTTT